MSLKENAPGDNQNTYKKATAKESAKIRQKLGTWVQINRYKVPIVYVKDLIVDGDAAVGAYDWSTKTMYINVEDPNWLETYYHERFHAEIIEGGVRQHPRWCKDLEEIIVEILSRSVAYLK